MKKLLFLCGAAMMAASCTNTPAPATISGELEGLGAEDSLLVFCNQTSDTIAVPNGVFSYEFTDSVPAMVSFYKYPKMNPDGTMQALMMKGVNVFMYPNTSLQVKGDFDNYTVTGTDFYKEYNVFKETAAEVDAKKAALSKEYLDLRRGEDVEAKKPQLDSLFELVKEVDGQRNDLMEKYIAEHLDSEVSLFLLYTNRAKFGAKYISQFSDAVKNGALKKMYTDLADYYEKMIAKEKAAEKIQEGKPAPDFTLKNLAGEDFTLSSLKGKYVVLDFWGSWCGWCIKGIPDMKNIYEKYKGKLEIVGIDCNDTEEKWKSAVEKYEINWINVINSKEKTQDLTTIYNISGFPTKLILSPEGTILKIVVGESPEFYEAIKSLVK